MTASAASLCILVIDDHPLARQGLRVLVAARHPDAAVVEAATGAQALELAAGRAPDLVLLDLHMPGGYPPAFFVRSCSRSRPGQPSSW